jgi:ribosomal protein S21
MQHSHLLQLQQARSMSVAVDVQGNNVDKALRILNKHFKEAGMQEELRGRAYRKTSAELKFDQKKAAHNKRVGVLIAQRLRWVVRRRKLKM